VTVDRTPPSAAASPGGGIYPSPQNVELASDEPAKIFFTLDGTDPTSDSPCYGSPIPITQSTTIRFVAVDRAGNGSGTLEETYIIGEVRRVRISGTVSNYPESPDCGKHQGFGEGTLSLEVSGPTDPDGWVRYSLTKPKLHLVGNQIQEVAIADGAVTITGTAEVNKKQGYTFTAVVVEGKRERFSIVIRKPDGSIYYDAPLQPACKGKIRVKPLK
jgi:hypothetical protein